MELVYLPDPMTRLGSWSAYSTWEEITFETKVKKQKSNDCKEIKTNERNCSICQQKKKRILSHYIKSKQNNCRNSTTIQEEKEEEEEKEEKHVEEEGETKN